MAVVWRLWVVVLGGWHVGGDACGCIVVFLPGAPRPESMIAMQRYVGAWSLASTHVLNPYEHTVSVLVIIMCYKS